MKKNNENIQALQDLTQDFEDAKKYQITVYEHEKNTQRTCHRPTEKNLQRMHDCATVVHLVADETLEHMKNVGKGDYCNNRFCPICMTRRAHKNGVKTFVGMKYMEMKYGYRYIFLTGTALNVTRDQVRANMAHQKKAIDRLFKLHSIRRIDKGHIIKFEQTYNRSANTYHLHWHGILAVEESYFDQRNNDYLTQEQWLNKWQNSMRDDRITQFGVSAVSSADAAKELSKYEAKPADLSVNQEVHDAMVETFAGRKEYQSAGCFTSVFKAFEADQKNHYHAFDPFINELFGGDEQAVVYVNRLIFGYRWKEQKYTATVEALNAEEMAQYNAVDYQTLDDLKADIKHNQRLVDQLELRLANLNAPTKAVLERQETLVWDGTLSPADRAVEVLKLQDLRLRYRTKVRLTGKKNRLKKELDGQRYILHDGSILVPNIVAFAAGMKRPAADPATVYQRIADTEKQHVPESSLSGYGFDDQTLITLIKLNVVPV